jgi:hypothetical protein
MKTLLTTSPNSKIEEARWRAKWLDAAADGSSMTQRLLRSIEERGGGLAALKKEAKARGIHLALITDDRGEEIVAASSHPFRVLC